MAQLCWMHWSRNEKIAQFVNRFFTFSQLEFLDEMVFRASFWNIGLECELHEIIKMNSTTSNNNRNTPKHLYWSQVDNPIDILLFCMLGIYTRSVRQQYSWDFSSDFFKCAVLFQLMVPTKTHDPFVILLVQMIHQFNFSAHFFPNFSWTSEFEREYFHTNFFVFESLNHSTLRLRSQWYSIGILFMFVQANVCLVMIDDI